GVRQASPPHRADEPLDERVLPGAVRRREDFTDPHPLHSLPKPLAVDGVAIAQEIGRGGGVREGVDDLLGGPGGGGMLRDVEVKDAAAVGGENDQDEEDAQAGRRHREEVKAEEVSDVIGEERSPGLGGRAAPRGEQTGDGAFGHPDAELEELGMDPRAPQTFSGPCQAICFCGCRSCCRAIDARWYSSSYEAWRCHMTKMIFNHLAPNARSARRCECPRARCWS